MSRFISEDDKVLLATNALYLRKITAGALVACLKSGEMDFWSPHVATFLTEVEPRQVFSFADRHGISNEELADAFNALQVTISEMSPAFGLALAARNEQAPTVVESKLVLDFSRHGISTEQLADAYRVVKTAIGEISSSLEAVLVARNQQPERNDPEQAKSAAPAREFTKHHHDPGSIPHPVAERKNLVLVPESPEQGQELEFGGEPLNMAQN